MNVAEVDVFFQDDERAGGVVKFEGGAEIPWTAIRNVRRQWCAVVHGTVDRGDANLLRLMTDTIHRALHQPIAKAA